VIGERGREPRQLSAAETDLILDKSKGYGTGWESRGPPDLR
jgi:hypothetical protein